MTFAFDGLLSCHDCSALSLMHPALTRPTQWLMLCCFSVKTNLHVQNMLNPSQVHHTLLPLVDILHLDTQISNAASLPTRSTPMHLVSPWLVDISTVGDGSAQVASDLDSVAFSPGLQLITLHSMQSSHGAMRRILWPLHWMKHGDFDNLKHFALIGVNLYFNSHTEWVSGLESFELEHCHLYSVDTSRGNGNRVSLLHVLQGSVATLHSLKLVSIVGVCLESVKGVIRAHSALLQHLHLSEVCQWTNLPVSLQTALASYMLYYELWFCGFQRFLLQTEVKLACLVWGSW
jgi:hypothetical protein